MLALLAAAALLATMLQASSSPRADALGVSPDVDAPSSYDAQTTCTKGPRPGTVALAKYLLRTYPVTRSMGMMRACSQGARSEHKDGRAFDWGADVAHAATKKAAYDFINKALATDSAGNPHALARQLGIMYIIYNDTIWASYRDFAPRPYLNEACSSRAKCSRTLRHLDHVHISLGFAGAAAQTSWYRERNVTSQPVFFPGTKELDPQDTAVTGFTVPANGALTPSPFLLRAGVTYRIVATGTIRSAADTVADANCVRTGLLGFLLADRGPLLGLPDPTVPIDPWNNDRTPSPYALPLPTTQGLTFARALRWEGGCAVNHTYEAWFTPPATQRLYFKYTDAAAADNTGTINVYVARDDITLASLKR
ncbi:hypothetical protein EFL95_18655 [Nocardioides marmorisolisilvae]|uniref:ARB-07466-like C-terminal domain-containing protein n=1 Tax=Nocardioides marmorisolisilvae TaxID=1542737 RepID=A0A3N0DIC1_9ACTN|nr:hypothetical protein EFL95_18655 [Nocardioides marmorisolisilvae]